MGREGGREETGESARAGAEWRFAQAGLTQTERRTEDSSELCGGWGVALRGGHLRKCSGEQPSGREQRDVTEDAHGALCKAGGAGGAAGRVSRRASRGLQERTGQGVGLRTKEFVPLAAGVGGRALEACATRGDACCGQVR